MSTTTHTPKGPDLTEVGGPHGGSVLPFPVLSNNAALAGQIAAVPSPHTGRAGRVLAPTLDLPKIARDGLPPLDWLLPGWLLRGDVVILAGDAGDGKSTTLAALTLAASTGGECFGERFVEPMPTLLFDEEQGERLCSRLLIRMGAGELGQDQLAVFCNLGLNLRGDGQEPNLADLEATIADYGRPVFVGIDSWVAASGITSEIDNPQIESVTKQLRRIMQANGGACVILHHANRPSTQNPRARKHRYRGGTALLGGASAGFFQERQGGSIVLAQDKRRGADELLSVRLVLDAAQGEAGPLVLTSTPLAQAENSAQQLEDLLLAEAERRIGRGERSVTTAQLIEAGAAQGNDERTIKRAIARLARPTHGAPRLIGTGTKRRSPFTLTVDPATGLFDGTGDDES